jgi:hypothetical protein
MRADQRADHSGQHHQRGDVEARLVGNLAVNFAPAFDHDDDARARPLVACPQPVDIMDHRVGQGLDTAVIGIDGFVRTGIPVFKGFCSSTKTATSSRRVL